MPIGARSASVDPWSIPPALSAAHQGWWRTWRARRLVDVDVGVGMDRISAEDQLVLGPDQLWPQDIGALALLDGRHLRDGDGCLREEHVRRAVEARLPLIPRFRRVLYDPPWGLGRRVWVDDAAFDIQAHVRMTRVPEPGDEAALLDTVAELRRERLGLARPMWQMWLLDGLPEQRVGLFIRLHHVLADGIAGVASLAAFLDTVPGRPSHAAQPWAPQPGPDGRALLTDNLWRRADGLRRAAATLSHPNRVRRGAAGRWRTLRELLVDDRADPTSLNRVIGRDRDLALLRGDLAAARDAAHAHGGTVNDLLLTVTAGGLRALLAARAEHVEVVRAYVPVSLRPRPRVDPGEANMISQMVVPLPVGVPDPGRRLELIAAQTARRKGVPRPSLGSLFANPLLAALFLRLMRRNPVNVEIADVPGPPVPVYFAGARVLEVAPLVNLIGNVTLGVGALSYAGQLGIMAVADTDAVPDLPVFASAAQADLDLLGAAPSRVPGTPSG